MKLNEIWQMDMPCSHHQNTQDIKPFCHSRRCLCGTFWLFFTPHILPQLTIGHLYITMGLSFQGFPSTWVVFVFIVVLTSYLNVTFAGDLLMLLHVPKISFFVLLLALSPIDKHLCIYVATDIWDVPVFFYYKLNCF